MFKAYKIISTRSFLRINTPFRFLGVFLLLFSCQTVKTDLAPARLSQTEVTYQKGSALFDNEKYAEAASFFLKVSQNPLGPDDEIYNQALWKLTLVYEKFGEYEKAILALNELKNRNPKKVSLLSIRFALVKNYIRLGNTKKALELLNKISTNYPINEIYASLEDSTHFNYDLLMVEELQFLGEIQKYFIFVMEGSDYPLNEKATLNLIGLYEGFLKTLTKDTYNQDFKKSVAVEMLEQLRKFDLYKLNEINFNLKTIPKFSNYSTEKQKFITDWLHQ